MARAHGRLIDVVEAVDRTVDGHPSCVALGGGADSATLLAAVAASGAPVRGVFADHGLPTSPDLASAVAKLAAHLRVELTVVDARVEDGPGLEDRARTARYVAIEGQLAPDELALTAHTRDDQAETVVMRMMAGAGSTGLSGIPARRGRWVRPLLGFGRAELRAIADDEGLPYTDDPANEDRRFERTRIRHDVLPFLEEASGPGAAAALARSAEHLAADDALLSSWADRVGLARRPGAVRIPAAPLTTAPAPVAARIVRNALRSVGDHHPGTARDVSAVLDTAVTGRTNSLSGGIVAVAEGSHVAVGELPHPEAGIRVEPDDRFDWFGASYRIRRTTEPPTVVDGGRHTLLAASAVPGGVGIRGFEPADRIDIGIGSTPVAELLRSAGVPAHLRPVSPLATTDGNIAAIIGVRVAAWARPDGGPVVVIEREVGT